LKLKRIQQGFAYTYVTIVALPLWSTFACITEFAQIRSLFNAFCSILTRIFDQTQVLRLNIRPKIIRKNLFKYLFLLTFFAYFWSLKKNRIEVRNEWNLNGFSLLYLISQIPFGVWIALNNEFLFIPPLYSKRIDFFTNRLILANRIFFGETNFFLIYR
jgi:hypothetical protein